MQFGQGGEHKNIYLEEFLSLFFFFCFLLVFTKFSCSIISRVVKIVKFSSLAKNLLVFSDIECL